MLSDSSFKLSLAKFFLGWFGLGTTLSIGSINILSSAIATSLTSSALASSWLMPLLTLLAMISPLQCK